MTFVKKRYFRIFAVDPTATPQDVAAYVAECWKFLRDRGILGPDMKLTKEYEELCYRAMDKWRSLNRDEDRALQEMTDEEWAALITRADRF